MPNVKAPVLVRALLDQTLKGKLVWVETTSAQEYQLAFPDYAVRIREFPGGPVYVLSIYNKNGTEIERIEDSDIPGGEPLLERLFTRVRGKVTGSDAAIDSILAALMKGLGS